MGCIQSTLVDTHPRVDIQPSPARTRPSLVESKIVILGDSGVGKSSISLRFAQGVFPRTHEVTVGAAFLQNSVRLSDGSMHKLQIWDSGGSERFRAMAPLYYRDAWGCLLVFDVTDPKSFESITYWLTELRVKGPDYCVVYVVANKTDLLPAFDLTTVESFCAKEAVKFFKVSALTGTHVHAVFTELAQDISKKKNNR